MKDRNYKLSNEGETKKSKLRKTANIHKINSDNCGNNLTNSKIVLFNEETGFQKFRKKRNFFNLNVLNHIFTFSKDEFILILFLIFLLILFVTQYSPHKPIYESIEYTIIMFCISALKNVKISKINHEKAFLLFSKVLVAISYGFGENW